MALRDHSLATIYYNLLQNHVLPVLRRYRLQPDQVTLIGAALAFGVPLGFAWHPLAGFIFLLLSGSIDALDGHLARTIEHETPWGAFLDSSMDRLSDGFYLLGFWILFWQTGQDLIGGLLIWPALIATLMISYIKARAESLGGDCSVGLMERAARILYLCAWALCLAILPAMKEMVLMIGAVVYLGLVAITIVQRIQHVHQTLGDSTSSHV